MSVDGTKLLFEGFLQKRKDTMKLRWATYWFRLHNTTLFFYTKENCSASHLRGYYYIYTVQSVRTVHREDSQRFMFEIIMTNGKRKMLAAETEDLRKEWVDQLWKAMHLSTSRFVDYSSTYPNMFERERKHSVVPVCTQSDSEMESVSPRPLSAPSGHFPPEVMDPLVCMPKEQEGKDQEDEDQEDEDQEDEDQEDGKQEDEDSEDKDEEADYEEADYVKLDYVKEDYMKVDYEKADDMKVDYEKADYVKVDYEEADYEEPTYQNLQQIFNSRNQMGESVDRPQSSEDFRTAEDKPGGHYDVLPIRKNIPVINDLSETDEGVYDVPTSSRRTVEPSEPKESTYDVPSSLLRKMSEHSSDEQLGDATYWRI